MSDFLETTHDKFLFRVKTGIFYSRDDFWVEVQDDQAVVGVSDFLQKVRGDVAFLETAAVGTEIRREEEAGTVETIKATFGLRIPVSGTIIAVNPALEASPFFINQEPYGSGWIYRLRLSDWANDRAELLDAEGYLSLMKTKIAEELAKK